MKWNPWKPVHPKDTNCVDSPVSITTDVEVFCRNGDIIRTMAGKLDWTVLENRKLPGDIIQWRLI